MGPWISARRSNIGANVMREGYVDIREGWGGTKWIPTIIEGWGGNISDGGTRV